MSGPTFADLCQNVRDARRAHNHAIIVVKAAREAVKVAEFRVAHHEQTEEAARAALDKYIDNETALD